MQPKLRAKGFNTSWKSKGFQDSFSLLKNNTLSRAELSSKGCVANIHYGDILIKFGEILNTSKEELPFVTDENTGLALYRNGALKKGDIIFADTAEDNTVGKATELICQEEELIVSGLHTIACRPIINFAESYLGYYLNSPAFHNQLLPHIQGTKVSSISRSAIYKTIIKFPKDIAEQQNIANYLLSLDTQISATNAQLSSLKKIKKGCLLSMFPQKGETVPKIRFKGFVDNWEEKKLGDFFDERIENNPNAEMLSVTLNNGVIKASENGRFDNSNNDKSKYKVVKKGDIAYNSMRMWQGASGCSQYEGIVSPAYTVITGKEGVNTLFFAYLFKTDSSIEKFRLNSQGMTKDTWNLKFPAFSQIKMSCPNSLNEQIKIANFFTNLDKQISLQEQKLEKLKQIKSACLDNMFV